MKEWYYLCGIIGGFCNILKFRYVENEVPKSYTILRKHLDEQIDAEIENLKTGKGEIIYQNNLYIIFGIDSNEVSEMNLKMVKKVKIYYLVFP